MTDLGQKAHDLAAYLDDVVAYSTTKVMFVVAIQLFHGDEESRIRRLMDDAELTLMEARARVRGPGPRVLGTFATRARADALADRLTFFEPIVLGAEELEMGNKQLSVRSFSFGEHALQMNLKDGDSMETPYTNIDLLLRGTRHDREQRRRMTNTRSRSGRFVRITPTYIIESKDKREQFLYIYAQHGPKLAFLETELVFKSLGAMMQPTRSANFARLIAELRARIPTARYDERLLTHAGQLHVLGGLLMPESYLDVATTLLARTLRPPTSPYR